MTIRIVFSFLALVTLLLAGCGGTETGLYHQLPPVSQTNHIVSADLGDAGEYWNLQWRGRAAELHHSLLALTWEYSQTHEYVFGESDCNDMAIDIWNDLASRGITSLIVVGNLEMSHESFAECNHAWLIVYNGEGAAAALDPSCGGVYCWEDTQEYPYLKQYWEGIVYQNPTDLWNDFQERW
ncbi:MAG TPA: hypothetical protein G4O10_03295 [Dehalococcoidia bacterium]|nr:hypothetical protein [Dehalococcoidia bacterium]